MAERPSLHASQLDMLSRCPLQYYYRYVLGEVRPPAVAMLVGTATHKSVEANLQHKIASGDLLPLDAVQEAAKDALEARWAGEGVMLDDEERERGVVRVKGDAVDDAVTYATLHATEVAPEVQPVAVERTFRIDLKGYPVDLVGTIDIEDVPGLRDTKTSGKSPQEDAAAKSVQLTVYSMALQALNGKPTGRVRLDYLVKTKVPKVVSMESARDEHAYRALLDRVARAARLIESGAFYPTSPDNWVCSKRFCGWWGRCPHGASGRTQA